MELIEEAKKMQTAVTETVTRLREESEKRLKEGRDLWDQANALEGKDLPLPGASSQIEVVGTTPDGAAIVQEVPAKPQDLSPSVTQTGDVTEIGPPAAPPTPPPTPPALQGLTPEYLQKLKNAVMGAVANGPIPEQRLIEALTARGVPPGVAHEQLVQMKNSGILDSIMMPDGKVFALSEAIMEEMAKHQASQGT
jgi:hypothetical protein